MGTWQCNWLSRQQSGSTVQDGIFWGMQGTVVGLGAGEKGLDSAKTVISTVARKKGKG